MTEEEFERRMRIVTRTVRAHGWERVVITQYYTQDNEYDLYRVHAYNAAVIATEITYTAYALHGNDNRFLNHALAELTDHLNDKLDPPSLSEGSHNARIKLVVYRDGRWSYRATHETLQIAADETTARQGQVNIQEQTHVTT